MSWTNLAEFSIGTDPCDACPAPPDNSGDGLVLSNDVFFITSRFFLTSSDTNYTPLADIGNLTGPRDGIILSNDVFAATSRFFTGCTP
ncbi:MAG: hypothetical protein IH822_05425 [Chloroflexi bacterium]|nr:hypothetical protein [Chloroflexota bacterium]